MMGILTSEDLKRLEGYDSDEDSVLIEEFLDDEERAFLLLIVEEIEKEVLENGIEQTASKYKVSVPFIQKRMIELEFNEHGQLSDCEWANYPKKAGDEPENFDDVSDLELEPRSVHKNHPSKKDQAEDAKYRKEQYDTHEANYIELSDLTEDDFKNIMVKPQKERVDRAQYTRKAILEKEIERCGCKVELAPGQYRKCLYNHNELTPIDRCGHKRCALEFDIINVQSNKYYKICHKCKNIDIYIMNT